MTWTKNTRGLPILILVLLLLDLCLLLLRHGRTGLVGRLDVYVASSEILFAVKVVGLVC